MASMVRHFGAEA